ncbi:MAG: hypothetical protein LKI24_16640 [Acidipropionibacterium sp.]|jgi:predicted ArsR family transcriptional regulator|nr:hypothetical protein [Acidipropionibacterium sp.]
MADRGNEGLRAEPGSRRSLSRAELLEVLGREGACTVSMLAARTGLHENTIRGHLDRLLAGGRVIRATERPTGRGRPSKVYRLAGTDPSEPGEAVERDRPQLTARAAAIRAEVLGRLVCGYGAGADDVTAAAVGDGAQMARTIPLPPISGEDPQRRQFNTVLAQLEDSGFAPHPDPDGMTVNLWGCPVRDLASGRTEVICAMHLGMERELAQRAGGPLEVESLCPFVGPRQCRLRLTHTNSPSGPPGR